MFFKVIKRSLDPGLPASKIATGGGLKNRKTVVKTDKTESAPSTATESKPAGTPSQVEEKTEAPKKKFGGLKGLKKVKAKGSFYFQIFMFLYDNFRLILIIKIFLFQRKRRATKGTDGI